MRPTLELLDVVAGYRGGPVLKGVNLALTPGFHVLLGVNGSGKTTLFRVVTGVLRPRRGEVRVLGESPAESPDVRRAIGYLSHRSGFYPAMKASDCLEFWCRVLGLPREQRRREIERLAAELNLSELLDRETGTLSRGQQQRLSVARALIADPPVLVLDEPTAGLDPLEARRMRELLTRIGRQDRTIVYSTHNMYEAAELAQNLLVLVGGRVVAQGSIDDLRRRGYAEGDIGTEPVQVLETVFERLNKRVANA
jgi:ABC-2 type transport system ATP-binding protein